MTPRTLIHGVILGAFCLGIGVLLSVTDRLTATGIAARALEDRQNSLSQVIPASLHDNNPVTDALVLKDDRGEDITVYRALKQGGVTGVAPEDPRLRIRGRDRLMRAWTAGASSVCVSRPPRDPGPGRQDRGEGRLDPALHRPRARPSAGREVEGEKGRPVRPVRRCHHHARGVVAAIRTGLEFFAAHQGQLMRAIWRVR
jgi:electron transport complex protein RnfG